MKTNRHTKEVDDFIKKSQHPLKKEMIVLREIILSAHKGITEHIKWNAPSFCFNGDDRITLNLSKKDCILIVFHRGAKVKDTKNFVFRDTSGLFQWKTPDRAQVQFSDVKEIELKREALTQLASEWVKVTID